MDFLERLIQPVYQDGTTVTISGDPTEDRMNYSRERSKNSPKLNKMTEAARKAVKGKKKNDAKRKTKKN